MYASVRGKFLGIVAQNPSDSKSNQLHVGIFRFCFHSFEVYSKYSSKMIDKFPEVSNFNPLFMNSTGSSATNRWLFPDIGMHIGTWSTDRWAHMWAWVIIKEHFEFPAAISRSSWHVNHTNWYVTQKSLANAMINLIRKIAILANKFYWGEVWTCLWHMHDSTHAENSPGQVEKSPSASCP